MKPFASLLIAGLLGAATTVAANAALATNAPAPLTRDSGWVHSSTVAAIVVLCPTSSTAAAQLNKAGVAPNHVYSYVTTVNGVITHMGHITSSSTGVASARTAVANLKSSTVGLKLNGGSVVNGPISPRCGMLPAGYIAAPSLTAARGSATAYTLHKNSNGTVTRWNPCDGAIHVRVNPTGGGIGALSDAQAALKALSTSTGLKFVYDGTTTFIPRSTNAGSQPAAVVIAWGTRSQTDYLGTGAIGEGGWRSSGVSTDGVHWTWKITKGFVVVDPAAKVTPGFGRGVSRGALLMHELGHVAGLGHTTDTLQVMAPVLSSSSYSGWGSGDRAGLVKVGATQGCVPAR